MKVFSDIYKGMTSSEALFEAWFAFRKGKAERRDVQEFGRYVERNIFRLHRALQTKNYRHNPYESFYIHDPKVRHIRKACVQDRVVHQTAYTTLNRLFEPCFIHHLYSSRLGKGTHRGVEALRIMSRKISKNNSRACWSLKCDIRKFYDTVDHTILLNILQKRISDNDAIWLCREIVESFHHEGTPGKGLPIGNLTSQIFTNIYLNEFDQFVKHELRRRYYLRFADDFLLLSTSKTELEDLLPRLKSFLSETLSLEIHPKKVILRPLHQGIDFLGYVTLPHHRVLRTATKRRMLRKLSKRHAQYFDGEVSGKSLAQSMQSYLGILSHANAHTLEEIVKNRFCWRGI